MHLSLCWLMFWVHKPGLPPITSAPIATAVMYMAHNISNRSPIQRSVETTIMNAWVFSSWYLKKKRTWRTVRKNNESFHWYFSLYNLNLKISKTWSLFSNNVSPIIRRYSSSAFIWAVTFMAFLESSASRSFLGLVKFAFGSERVNQYYTSDNRVLKWWRHENDFSKIMGFIRLFGTTYLKSFHTQIFFSYLVH